MKSLWEGPDSTKPNGGISYSMLSTFIIDRHDFWLAYVKGMDDYVEFDHKMEFGSMLHAAMEHTGPPNKLSSPDKRVNAYVKGLNRRFPESADDIARFALLAKRMYPTYRNYWASMDKKFEVLSKEQVFDEKVDLGGGYRVRLRGKMDGVIENSKGIWLLEHKAKGYIDEDFLKKTLATDLQTNLYLFVLRRMTSKVRGVCYDVIRRPLGTSASPKPRKGENWPHFLDRVFSTYDGKSRGYPINDDPAFWFLRWMVSLTKRDTDRFWQRVIQRHLFDLCEWWEEVSRDPGDPWRARSHRQRPSGVFDYQAFSGSKFVNASSLPLSESHWPRKERLFSELA